MLVKMKVAGIAIDPLANTPIVILKDLEEQNIVPIWIGILEASAIAAELEKISIPRPLTHILTKNIIKALGAELKKVIISDLKESTFFAELFIDNGKEVIVVDARPSDALALAISMEAPIFVEEKVINKSGREGLIDDKTKKEFEEKKWAEILDNLSPEDFGKYKM